MQLIEQDTSYDALYDTEHKILNFSVSGYLDVMKIRRYLARQVEWARENKIVGVCADLTQMDGTITPVAGYIANEYLLPLKAMGMIAFAIIVSKEILCKIAARDFVAKMGEHGVVLFHEKHEASKWLENYLLENKMK